MSILLKTVKSEVKQQQSLELRLYVHKNNVAAVKAYEKANFKHSDYRIMTLSQ